MKKKFKPIKYGGGEGRYKIKVEDADGRCLENWTIMMSDLGRWVKMQSRKYGGNKIDTDLGWAA